MRRIEVVLAGITAGSMALGTIGGIEMYRNTGANTNQGNWENEKSTLTSEIVNSLPQDFSQATKADQAKIDELRRQLSTVNQELATNAGSADTEYAGEFMLSAGGLVFW